MIRDKEDWALALYVWASGNTVTVNDYDDAIFELIHVATQKDRFLIAQIYPTAVEVYLQCSQARTKEAFYNMFPKIRALMKRGGNRIITL